MNVHSKAVKLYTQTTVWAIFIGSIVYFDSCCSSPQDVIFRALYKVTGISKQITPLFRLLPPVSFLCPSTMFQARAATANKDILTVLQSVMRQPETTRSLPSLTESKFRWKKLTLVRVPECDQLIISSSMQGMSAINFAKIHKLVFDTSCIQEMITHKQTYTDRRQTRLNT